MDPSEDLILIMFGHIRGGTGRMLNLEIQERMKEVQPGFDGGCGAP